MIEDILKANPGMQETYRAYARETVLTRRIEALQKERALVVAQTNGQARNEGTLATIDADLAKYKEALEETKREIRRCQEFEKSQKAKVELVR